MHRRRMPHCAWIHEQQQYENTDTRYSIHFYSIYRWPILSRSIWIASMDFPICGNNELFMIIILENRSKTYAHMICFIIYGLFLVMWTRSLYYYFFFLSHISRFSTYQNELNAMKELNRSTEKVQRDSLYKLYIFWVTHWHRKLVRFELLIIK